jgi:putative ABC transport system ATP-binding protein
VFFTNEIETHALAGVHLEIRSGEFVSIAGPSGCGKSTLLSILGLLDTPTEGSYLLNGQPAQGLSLEARARVRNREIGFIFQSFNLIGDLTVFENVELPLTYRDMPGGERRRRVTEALERVGMAHRAKHLPSQLSGGQQQRVAVARALAGQPSVLLSDEPTGNLDSRNGGRREPAGRAARRRLHDRHGDARHPLRAPGPANAAALRRPRRRRTTRTCGGGLRAHHACGPEFSIRALMKTPVSPDRARTLALGIGATVAVFSVVNATLLVLCYAEPDRLSLIYSGFRNLPNGSIDGFELSEAEYLDVQRESRSWESLDAWLPRDANLTTDAEPARVPASFVTGGLMSSLGVAAAYGRVISAQDDEPGAPPVAVLSHDLWQRAFAGDHSLVGRDVVFNGSKHLVIGVMPAGYRFPIGAQGSADVWGPAARPGARQQQQPRAERHRTAEARRHTSERSWSSIAGQYWGQTRSGHHLDPKDHPLGSADFTGNRPQHPPGAADAFWCGLLSADHRVCECRQPAARSR